MRFEPNPREDCVQMTGKNVGMRRSDAAQAAKGCQKP
jgi:hypothetical protein